MPRNIEIKARARDFERQTELAASLADGPAEIIDQEDIFYRTERGRLKLRTFPEGTGELIFYRRPDQAGPKTSNYEIFKTDDPARLKLVLDGGLDRLGVVKKRRILYLCGQTRIHLDHVEGLGRFLELEVVLRPGQTENQGQAEAKKISRALTIREIDLIKHAYLDLILKKHRTDNI